jgi:hypothetical protein
MKRRCSSDAYPDSVNSRTVIDEVSLATEEGKTVIPCVVKKTALPMRVRRNHWIDFMRSYDCGFGQLLRQLREWSGETRANAHKT